MLHTTSKHATPTVDLKLLRPGDILLTTQATFTSWAIRTATHSEYSHVQLHIGQGLVTEAVPDKGTVFSVLRLCKVEALRPDGHKVFVTVPGATKIHVYRHRDLAQQTMGNDEEMALATRVNQAAMQRWGKDYALLHALGEATKLLERRPALKRAMLKTVGSLGPDKHKVLPGDFCSQLVAGVLEDLRLPLFRKIGIGEIPSPQSFADLNNSNMVRVAAAEICPDQRVPADPERAKTEQTFLDNHLAPRLNELVNRQRRQLFVIDNINAGLGRIAEDLRARPDNRDAR